MAFDGTSAVALRLHGHLSLLAPVRWKCASLLTVSVTVPLMYERLFAFCVTPDFVNAGKFKA
jgi:hypothetical protein